MIRIAEEKDIPKLLILLRQIANLHHQGRPDIFKNAVTKYTAKEISQIIKNEKNIIFVATGETDEVLGYALCEIRILQDDIMLQDKKTLFIDDFCIDEQNRHNGIGKLLFDFTLQYSKEINCDNIELNVWCCNPSAIHFYEKYGMKPKKYVMELDI